MFEYVRENFDIGDKIKFITRDGLDVDISKSEFTNEEVEHCLNGCFTGDTLVKTKEGLKRIDSIKEGNIVFSKNIETTPTQLIHHHIGGGRQAVRIPKPLHPGFGGVHNTEKNLGIWGSDSPYAEMLQKFLNK